MSPPNRRPFGKPGTAALRTDNNDTVTGWIKGLGGSRHENASHRLWDRYFTRIARLAQGRLRSMAGCPCDGEDVALSVFESFFRARRPGDSSASIAARICGGCS